MAEIHISVSKRHTNNVAFFIALFVVETLLILLTAPWKVRATGYLSTDGKRALVRLQIVSLPVLRIKAELKKDSVRITINGKSETPADQDENVAANPDKAQFKVKNLSALARFVSESGILKRGRVSVALGGDGMSCALGAAAISVLAANLLPQKTECRVFPLYDGEGFNADISLDMGISLFQALRLYRISAKR